MGSLYLCWLEDLLEEAQVPCDPAVDAALRRISGCGAEADDEQVYRALRDRWLIHGPPGRQLLGSLLRGEVYSRPDSPLRPHEGVGYFTNDATVPVPRR